MNRQLLVNAVMVFTLATWVLMLIILVTSILTANVFLFKLYIVYWGLSAGTFFFLWSKDFADPDTSIKAILSRKGDK